MKNYPSDKIRNICLMGHGGSGKTSLIESMLYISGGTDRMGKTADGNTVCDYDPEEIKRKISISTTVAPVEWNGYKLNLIDTPGYFDFAGEVIQGLAGADSALIVVPAADGSKVGTEKSFRYAKNRNLPTAFFLSKTDEEKADYDTALTSLRSKYGNAVCPVAFPAEGGLINIVTRKLRRFDKNGNMSEEEIPAEYMDKTNAYLEMLNEAICDVDESLIEKFFAGEPFTREETLNAFIEGFPRRLVFPVFCGCAYTGAGIRTLMDDICDYMPAPAGEVEVTDMDGEPQTITYDASAPTCAYVFKTIADPFVGKLSFFKVMSGSVKTNTTLINTRTGGSERIGHLMSVKGKKTTEIEECTVGDIAAATKLATALTGDALCADSRKVQFLPMNFPAPSLTMAVVAKAKGDEDKIASGLTKLMDEDPTFTFTTNPETKQQLLSGLGESHLDVITSKLKSKFGVGVDLEAPKVPYRETIRKTVEVEGKHKKQSGGHGQYGHVKVRFEPCDSTEMVFAEQVFGGSVPKNFFPAVEKGLRESVNKGVLAGFPVVNLKATLLDGSYHPVDSSEMAFKMAAHLAYKAGIKAANPTLLEPIGRLTVLAPDKNVGDIVGDINKRRGRMLGMSPSETETGYTVVEADCPMAPMFDYSIGLRAMTKGRGSFTFEFDRYEEAPANVAQQVMAENKVTDDDE